MSWFGRLVTFIHLHILRVAFKWCLRMICGKSQLERLLESSRSNKSVVVQSRASTVHAVERALVLSKSAQLNALLIDRSATDDDIEAMVRSVARIKVIRRKNSDHFCVQLTTVVHQIIGYQQLIDAVECARMRPYVRDDAEHEAMLLELWNLLNPDVALERRKSLQWQDIGFQGDDPATDFRGMGLLGLEQLVYMAQTDRILTARLLALSHHPIIGFPFAIAGIAMTALSRELLSSGALKNHFYNTIDGRPQMHHFHQVYCKIFELYHDAWLHANPSSVMEFNVIKNAFHRLLADYLQTPEAQLDANCSFADINALFNISLKDATAG